MVNTRTTTATLPNADEIDLPLLLRTLTAVKKGNFALRLPVEQVGLTGKIYDVLNDTIELHEKLAQEFERVGKAVGQEGKLTQRVSCNGTDGAWTGMVEAVNTLIDDLLRPTSEMSRVISAVARGDLSQTMALEVEGRGLQGESLHAATTLNTMVARLNALTSEVTRVVREVGGQGKLGSAAVVPGVAGTWESLIDTVNAMAGNLTMQMRNITEVITAVSSGDLSKKVIVEARGEILDLKNTVNTMVEQLGTLAAEVTRVAREVGTDGKLGGQAEVKGVFGTWKDLTENVNLMSGNLTVQLRDVSKVATAIAKGDLRQKITVEAKGEILQMKETINTMVEQLSALAVEVTRVAREVGTEGKLGGQAEVQGVFGTWKDLTENVNSMSGNLTVQLRDVSKVATAIAKGDLRQKITVEVKGEILQMKETINTMVEQLGTLAAEVIRVAREVGTDGKLGGQAEVKGVFGIWKDLTENVNGLAANLSTQVRAIAEVATAVTKGDLSRAITVEAAGEVAALKDNVNKMISNLRDTTSVNTEQDWLKTNLARFNRMLQGQRDLLEVSRLVLSELAPLVNAQHGVFYINEFVNGEPEVQFFAGYGYKERKHLAGRFRLREGLVGQCAFEKQRILLTEVPSDYIKISSGLGEAVPLNIVVLPVLFEHNVLAVIELASFQRFSETHLTFFDQLTESIGMVLNTIAATTRTEDLLTQSQSLATELQTQQEELRETNERLEQQAKILQASEERLKQQQEELQQTNEELEEKANLLVQQNVQVERKNREVEVAKQTMQEKAEQLALTSKYKSEFLANMSHELRTPLNSMLILSRQLTDNVEGNLTEKQVEYARIIHAGGADLLGLINDILDLSKIESGTTDINLTEVLFSHLQGQLERSFHPIAEGKGLAFVIESSGRLPQTINTDEKRLQQVLKNLLSNAFKFTEQGEVALQMRVAREGWSRDHESLNSADEVIAFAVSDTGIGIPLDKQRIIFEAFQQADAGTSRKYGGTGLGLSISREITTLLGGELCLVSTPRQGSTFTLYLPQTPRPTQTQRHGSHGDSAGGGTGGRPRSVTPQGKPADVRVATRVEPPGLAQTEVGDDRSAIQAGDRTLLIVEDDTNFARILLELAHDKGFKVMVATSAEEGWALARQFQPDAITLDVHLPEMDGWTLLDLLKHESTTRHLPVHMISADEESQRALQSGAIAYLSKPATREALDEAFTNLGRFIEHRVKYLLVVEDDEVQRQAVVALLENEDVRTTAVATGAEALAALQAQRFDCMVLDLGLQDMTGFELIQQMKQELEFLVPIIVYTARDLNRQEEIELRRVAATVIVKDVRSPERLLDEAALFLHQVETNLPEQKRRMLQQVRLKDPILAGKTILIVDDDMRNVFALTSILEQYGMQALYAENGKEGIDLLQRTPGIDLVLMDIMMPEMDGYETMHHIRTIERFKTLPIITLTAKAMKGDREKCIAAGASDYLPKPLDIDQLLSLLRVWLYKTYKTSTSHTLS